MTIREAFAKAKHPVPDGATIGYSWRGNDGGWFGRVSTFYPSDQSGQGFRFHGTWMYMPCEPGHEFEPPIDLSNLPAIDALDALPECVRKVVQ